MKAPGNAEAVEEAVVGTAGRDLRPPPARGEGASWTSAGSSTASRMGSGCASAPALLSTGPEDLGKAAGSLARSFETASTVLISRAEDVQLSRSRREGTRVIDLST